MKAVFPVGSHPLNPPAGPDPPTSRRRVHSKASETVTDTVAATACPDCLTIRVF